MRAWIGAHGVQADALVELALRAVRRIAGAESELRELWEEPGDPEWAEAVRDLQSRLGDGARRP